MFDELDAADIAQSIQQEREVFLGSFLLLEGKNDDKTLKRHVDGKKCSIQVIGNKSLALDVLSSLEDYGLEGVVCVIDVDYDYVAAEAAYVGDNVVLTGVHDLDVAITASSAFDIFKSERCNSLKVEAFEASKGLTLQQALFAAARPIGCLRLLSAANKRTIALNFANLDFDKFVDKQTLDVDQANLLTTVLANSRRQMLSSTEIEARFRIVSGKVHDPLMICQGHDLLRLFSIALRSAVADLTSPHTGRPDPRSWQSEVALGLRLAFGRQQFEETHLYHGLKAWEARNPPFEVLLRQAT